MEETNAWINPSPITCIDVCYIKTTEKTELDQKRKKCLRVTENYMSCMDKLCTAKLNFAH